MDQVSIIVPFYGVEEYLEACLSSLTRQSHENLEILCIDDCSPDGSFRIAQRFAAQDSRVKIIRHDVNKGLGGARNTGLRNAGGEYICFVDSDDYVTDNFVERLLENLKSHQADISVCNIWQDQDGGISPYQTKYRDECFTLTASRDNTFETAGRFNPACWNKMYTRRLLLDNQLEQPEQRYYEDVAFWVKAVFHSSKICSIEDRLYYYRQRSGSIMKNLTQKHIDDRFLFLDEINRFARDQLNGRASTDASKIAGAALQYVLRHIHYGETLLDDVSPAEKRSLNAHYQEAIRNFARAHDWPALPKIYEIYKREDSLRLNLRAERGAHDETKSRLADTAAMLAAGQKRIRRYQRALYASIALGLLVIGFLILR